MGATPQFSGNEVDHAISTIAATDNDDAMAIGNSADVSTVANSADNEIERSRKVAIENAKIKSVMSGMEKMNTEKVKVMDVNSLMEAFEGYLQNIQSSDSAVGIPVRFFIKKISKKSIIKEWLNKNYPSKDIQTMTETNTGNAKQQ